MGRCPSQSGSSGRPPKREAGSGERRTGNVRCRSRFPCLVSRSVQYAKQSRVRAPAEEALRVGRGDGDPCLPAAAQRARGHVRLDRATGPLGRVILHLTNDLVPRPHVRDAGGRAHPMDLPPPSPAPPPRPPPLPLPQPRAAKVQLPGVAPPAAPAPGPHLPP